VSLYVAGLLTIGDVIAEVTGGGSPAENSGARYANDVFEMRAYCWCEQDDCDMCAPCTCPDNAWRYFLNGREVSAEECYAGDWLRDGGKRRSVQVPERMCAVCRGEVVASPNFRHYGMGVDVWWYKYVGRGMQANRELTSLEWLHVQNECVSSLLAGGRRVWNGPPLPGSRGAVLDAMAAEAETDGLYERTEGLPPVTR